MRIHFLIAQQVITSILLAAFLVSASLHALAVAFLLLSAALWILALRSRQVMVLLIDRNGHVHIGEPALARGVELRAYLLRLGADGGPELVLLVDPRATFFRHIDKIATVSRDPHRDPQNGRLP
jgi:hypothetical protein